jgi:hypothetical protein
MEIPSWLAHRGALRLETAARVLGSKSAALALAKTLGSYRLEDYLARQLKLEGLELNDQAEIPVLSPERWLDLTRSGVKSLSVLSAEWEEQGIELVGILLSESERVSFFRFLEKSGAKELGAWEMAAVYEHFCFPKRRSMNLLGSTRPRV